MRCSSRQPTLKGHEITHGALDLFLIHLPTSVWIWFMLESLLFSLIEEKISGYNAVRGYHLDHFYGWLLCQAVASRWLLKKQYCDTMEQINGIGFVLPGAWIFLNEPLRTVLKILIFQKINSAIFGRKTITSQNSFEFLNLSLSIKHAKYKKFIQMKCNLHFINF